MLLAKLGRNMRLGLSSLWAHKLRSGLTTLGMVFGVASVICMLAIGEGLSYEAREQIKRLGSNNIIIRSVKPPEDTQPTRQVRRDIWFHGRRVDGFAVGTVPWYPRITGRRVLAGRFITPLDMHLAANICVLTDRLARELGGVYNPLGDVVKLGGDAYRVVGIIESSTSGQPDGTKGAGQSAREVYIPLTAARLRMGELIIQRQTGSISMERVELHGAIVEVDDPDHVLQTAEVVEALLKRFHEKQDYEIVVPLQLLIERERVKRIYNIVLGLLAAISLLVGGIGIMNIMLASVSERTPEIGIRRAIGARRRDVLAQFLTETVLLSGFGGLTGIALGVSMPRLITSLSGMQTIVTPWAIILAFGISALVGLVFGYYPAWRAANMDPIVALRHE